MLLDSLSRVSMKWESELNFIVSLMTEALFSPHKLLETPRTYSDETMEEDRRQVEPNRLTSHTVRLTFSRAESAGREAFPRNDGAPRKQNFLTFSPREFSRSIDFCHLLLFPLFRTLRTRNDSRIN